MENFESRLDELGFQLATAVTPLMVCIDVRRAPQPGVLRNGDNGAAFRV